MRCLEEHRQRGLGQQLAPQICPAVAGIHARGDDLLHATAHPGPHLLQDSQARSELADRDLRAVQQHIDEAHHLAVLGAEGRLERFVAAHDSGLVVYPLAFEGQVEGGVAMGLGYALTEDFPLKDCAPTARFGTLGLLRAADMPPVETLIVRKAALSGAGYGAKGVGEISTIPTASAVANAYRALDGRARRSLPLEGTPYGRKRR